MLRQEMWALLSTHYAIRALMYEATDPEQPDRRAFHPSGHCASFAPVISPGGRVNP